MSVSALQLLEEVLEQQEHQADVGDQLGIVLLRADDLQRSPPATFCGSVGERCLLLCVEKDRHLRRVIQPVAAVVLRIDQDHPLEVPATFH